MFEDVHSTRFSPSLLEKLYPQSVWWQLKLPAYKQGGENTGRDDSSSRVGGGFLDIDVSGSFNFHSMPLDFTFW